MGKLLFTVGLPRSGKSTFAASWLVLPGLQRSRVVLSGDAFRHAIHGHSYIRDAEGLVFASIDTAARALLHSGYDVLIDECNTTEASIRRILRITPMAEPVIIGGDVESCLARAKPYLVGPILRMSVQLHELMLNWPHNFHGWVKEEIMRRSYEDAN